MNLNDRIIRRAIFAALLTAVIVFLTTMLQAQPPGDTTPRNSREGRVETVNPEENFHRAHEDFIKKDMRAAAREIREASRYLGREAGELKGATGREMAESIRELDVLADGIEKGMVTTVEEMDKAFARAHRALADHYQRLSLELWSNKKISEAGKALKSSADHLERAISWSGKRIESGATKAINKSKDVAGRMISNAGWVSEEVGQALQEVGREIKSMRKDIERNGKKQ